MPNWGKRIDSLEALLAEAATPRLGEAQGATRPTAPKGVPHRANARPIPDPVQKFQTVYLAVCSGCGWEREGGPQRIRENAMRSARQHVKRHTDREGSRDE